MKKVIEWLLLTLILLIVFFTGFLVRQPKINKLKKQIETLQKQLSSLQDKMVGYQTSFDNLLLQYKGLKVIQLKKKAEMKGLLEENLVLQYGMKAYLNLLLNRVKNDKKLDKEELAFYNAFDSVIEGKKVSTNEFKTVKSYVISRYHTEIQSLTNCDFSLEFKMLEEYNINEK